MDISERCLFQLQFYFLKLNSFSLSYLKSTIPETEIDNKLRKEVHIIYTNVPQKLYVYRNASIRTFVREFLHVKDFKTIL